MGPWNLAQALLFFLAATAMVWVLRRDLQRGTSGDDLATYDARNNPLGYPMMIGVKIFALFFFLAEAAHAIGLMDEPMTLLPGWMR